MWGVPLQLIVFSLPSVIYALVQKRRGERWREILGKLGWQAGSGVYYVWAIGIVVVLGALGWLAFRSLPAQILEDSNVNIRAYAGWTPGLGSFALILLREAIYTALGEEVLFRGLLGGLLVRRLGFAVGNCIQALLFLLPHLLLLLIDLRLWPVLLVQALAGWLLGWLRYRSESLLPGWLAHSLVNAAGAFAVLM